MWLTLNLLIVLAVLSIYGAFLGADKAREFFNSPALAIFWGVCTLLLTAGLIIFPSLRRRPTSFFLHAGCILILLGGLCGSQTGQKWISKKTGRDKIYKAVMLIYENQATNQVYTEKNNTWAQLPFEIRLDDFSLDYYPGILTIETPSGPSRQIRTIPGAELTLDSPALTLRVLDTYKNCRLRHNESGQMTPYDDTGLGINPACSIEVITPDRPPQQRTIFARFPGHHHPDDALSFTYNVSISDYHSHLTIVDKDKPVLSKTIEVNHPLHYGGYHFYQHSYDNEQAGFTVLTVVSDSGLRLVYLGYLLLGGGVFTHFWLIPAYRRITSPAAASPAAP